MNVVKKYENRLTRLETESCNSLLQLWYEYRGLFLSVRRFGLLLLN